MTAGEVTTLPGVQPLDHTDGAHYDGPQLATITGATYRQIDHWTRCGYLDQDQPRGPGSGRPRHYNVDDAELIRLVLGLLTVHIEVKHAFTLARHLIAHGSWGTQLADIYTLRIEVTH